VTVIGRVRTTGGALGDGALGREGGGGCATERAANMSSGVRATNCCVVVVVVVVVRGGFVEPAGERRAGALAVIDGESGRNS